MGDRVEARLQKIASPSRGLRVYSTPIGNGSTLRVGQCRCQSWALVKGVSEVWLSYIRKKRLAVERPDRPLWWFALRVKRVWGIQAGDGGEDQQGPQRDSEEGGQNRRETEWLERFHAEEGIIILWGKQIEKSY